MKETTIDQTLVLCDLDSLLLDAAGNLPQLQRDVLQLFASRGGRLTVFSQRSPRAVRSLLGGVRLSAPALVCGGTLAYNFSEGSGTALCSFEGMEESVLKMLPSLSGVGRKTANLILGDVYGQPSYVCDTHCIRITGRLGITDGSKDPVKVEQQLRKAIPPAESGPFCHRMVLFGRDVCTARSPKCEDCPLKADCAQGKKLK